ncbi:MAG: restriction endonuclease subunit S, partial [Clostridiales bacterium]|nr:restriction endonuclease subunit S [Clostridiales bacterium]
MSRRMKDSGVAWIGEIPEEWSVVVSKSILYKNDGGVWGGEPTGKEDTMVLRSTEQDVDGKLNI